MTSWQKPFRGFSLNLTHPLAPDHAWIFNELTGRKIFDQGKQRNNHLTMGGTDDNCAWDVDRVNFPDSSGFNHLQLGTEIEMGANKTLIMGVRPSFTDADPLRCLAGYDDSDNYYGLLNTNDLRLQDNGNNNKEFTLGTYTSGEMLHIALTADNSNWYGYRNGESIGSTSYSTYFRLERFGWGYINGDNYVWYGDIVYCLFFDRFLPQSAIRQLYQNPFAAWVRYSPSRFFGSVAAGGADLGWLANKIRQRSFDALRRM